MLHPSTIQLLRFHFSLFLAPVYFFALSQVPVVDWKMAVLVFGILHLLVYPASNAYNSYMDRDETPIGGLENPMAPTRQLFYVSLIMDALAIVLSFFAGLFFMIGIIIYILLSRAYSYRGIRLKRFPGIGFLTVFICQGALIFWITYEACNLISTSPNYLALAISSLLIGALYPLTQIYQYEADLADGVKTISYQLGKRGTFIFSAMQFLIANVCFYFLSRQQDRLNQWWLFLVMLLPVVLFFLYWMSKVWQNASAADFRNSLRMNVLSTCCTTAFFITLNLLNH